MPLPQLVELEYEKQIFGIGAGNAGYVFLIDGREVWLPRSATKVDADNKKITIPRSLAREKGLIK
jgi:hypothetical protein